MKNINWNDVDEQDSGTGGNSTLPNGAYVCTVTEVIDHDDYTNSKGESSAYIEVVFDIAEGEHKGFYKDFADNRKFLHTVKLWYEKLPHQFKHFYRTLERENNFEWNMNDTSTFVGKKFGCLIRKECYVWNDECKDKTDVCKFLSLDEARSFTGEVEDKVSEEYKQLKAQENSTSGDADWNDDSEVPFQS